MILLQKGIQSDYLQELYREENRILATGRLNACSLYLVDK